MVMKKEPHGNFKQTLLAIGLLEVTEPHELDSPEKIREFEQRLYRRMEVHYKEMKRMRAASMEAAANTILD